VAAVPPNVTAVAPVKPDPLRLPQNRLKLTWLELTVSIVIPASIWIEAVTKLCLSLQSKTVDGTTVEPGMHDALGGLEQVLPVSVTFPSKAVALKSEVLLLQLH
jgi:hypothetical protein